MVTDNPQIRQKALASLKGRWSVAILASFLIMAISGALGAIPGVKYVVFLASVPLGYGVAVWFLNFIRSSDGGAPEISTLFDGFKDYARVFITLFLVGIYTMLWTLLLIVPGIIKGLSYSMTSYILKDNPELKENAAIELSMAMMEGHKMKLFLMQLNFVMWILLSCLTLGIGLLWVMPYMSATLALFYEDVKSDYEAKKIAPSVE